MFDVFTIIGMAVCVAFVLGLAYSVIAWIVDE